VLETGGGTAVLCWGVSDQYSWANTQPSLTPAEGAPGTAGSKVGGPARPLPFDDQYRRKPMWYALARAFEGRPWP
jgi:endo-1,4-beta-xylanase